MRGLRHGQGRGGDIAVIAAGLLLAVAVWLVTVANVFREHNADFAVRVSPFAARAEATVAARRAVDGAKSGRLDAAAKLARDALRADPTAVPAATALGIAYSVKGQAAAADRAFGYAARLSRRDTLTQLWMIERAVARGDVSGALDHYDIVLRRVTGMRSQLYPILSNAASEPQVAARLAQLLQRRGEWTTEFVGQFVFQQNDPVVLDTVTRGYLDVRRPGERAILGALMTRMAELGRPDLAWARYRATPGARTQGAIVRDPDFAAADPLPPFDWSYAKDAAAPDRSVVSAAGGQAMLVPVELPGDVDLARQLLVLTPGGYRLSLRSGGIAGNADERPVVSVRCTTAQAAITTMTLPAGDGGARGAGAGFRVPAGCRFAWLTIRARNILDNAAAGEPGWIRAVAVTPVGQRR